MRRLLRAHQEDPLLRLLLQHRRRARLRGEGGLRGQHRPRLHLLLARRGGGRGGRGGGLGRQDPLLLAGGGPQPQDGGVQVRPQGAELLLVVGEQVGRRLAAPGKNKDALTLL